MVEVGADGLQQPEHPKPGDVHGEFRDLETDLDMALGAQVVDLVRFHPIEDLAQGTHIGQVPIVQKEMGIGMGPHMEVIDPFPVEG